MNRRRFLTTLAATAAANALPRAHAQQHMAHLEIDAATPGPTIPLDFTGLSYETAQLANPAFFSTANKSLIHLFRGLSPSGVLRLGGGSSEFTTFAAQNPTTPPPFEVFGPDTSKTVKHGTTNTPLAFHNLRAFLDATNWRCLYGLNLGQGTVENAVAEAAAVHQILGPRLIALQLGNEPDSFRNRYRPATYTPADYLREWNTFHAAILAKLPTAKFAGPDISNKIPYFTAFAEAAPQHPDVVLLTAHAYAMGPAGSPASTLENLLEPNPRVQTQSDEKLSTILEAAKQARLPYRMCEGNSCWDGGKPGVSDTLASALWCADYMLHLAQLGVSGINLHGGGNGFYTPIAGSPSTGFTQRPEYFGIQFAQQLTGSTFHRTTLTGASPRLTAYALQSPRQRSLVIVNKTDSPTTLTLPSNIRPHSRAVLLTGPTFDAKTQPTVKPVTIRSSSLLQIAPRSATLYTLQKPG
ncbi:MAG TPA: hypothetical protein VK627_06965 [Edaphobacter sp.]|nr:hypothetical protein [Edaphobacter sp.]